MTTTLTTNFGIPIPPLDTVGTADGYDTLMQAADTAIKNASGLSAWVDYSSTSVIVGWSAFTSKILKYKKVGTLVFFIVNLTGTSDDVSTTFTLPYGIINYNFAMIATVDNTVTAASGVILLNPATPLVATCYPTVSPSAWTAANDKFVRGQFFYEVA